MRDKLSILIMEGPDDKLAVEIYKDGPKALEAFSSLVGKPGDPPSRATFLHLDQNSEKIIHHEVRNLPIVPDPDDEPWGYELGVGPMEKPEDFDEDSGNEEG
jgi:hypothetical protein